MLPNLIIVLIQKDISLRTQNRKNIPVSLFLSSQSSVWYIGQSTHFVLSYKEKPYLISIYGYNPEDPKRQILNYYILLGKRHIFLQRSEIKPPSFDQFLEFVKDKLIVQRSIFYSKGQKAKFLSQWKPLLSLL